MLVVSVVTYYIVRDRPATGVAAAFSAAHDPPVSVGDAASPGIAWSKAALPSDPLPEIAPRDPISEAVFREPPAEPAPAADTAVPFPERVSGVLAPGLPWLVMAWLGGVFSLSVWHLGGWIAMQRLKHLGARPGNRQWTQRLADLMQRAHAIVTTSVAEYSPADT